MLHALADLCIEKQGDLSVSELACLTSHKVFLREVEVTKLDKSFKLILLESLLENDGFKAPANTLAIAQNSFGIFKRRQCLLVDLPEKYQALAALDTKQLKTWHTYWLNNPVKAWIGGSRSQGGKRAADKAYFKIEEEKLTYLTTIAPEELDAFNVMVQELVNYRFLQYEQRLANKVLEGESNPVNGLPEAANSIPYFSDLKIACGHFRTSSHETEEIEQIALPEKYGTMDLYLHQSFMRADIPGLFGFEFNKGAWEAGHVCPSGSDDQFILVTLNKQGKANNQRFHDYFTDNETFHWQSQNMVGPTGGRGQRLINHKANNSKLHLFVRRDRLIAKKGAPFFYCGTVNYESHEGEKPMSVISTLDNDLSEYLKLEFVG